MKSDFNNSIEYDLCSGDSNDFFHRYFTLSNQIEKNIYEVTECITGKSYALLVRNHGNMEASKFICMWSSKKYDYYIKNI